MSAEKFTVFAGRAAKVCGDNPLLPCGDDMPALNITRRRAHRDHLLANARKCVDFAADPVHAVDLRKSVRIPGWPLFRAFG